MEDFEWQDPLLITDVSSQQQQDQILNHRQNHCELATSCSLETSIMENPDDSSPTKIDGRTVLGFSLTSPDLVICVGSPDVTNHRYEESPEYLKVGRIDVSLENGIEASETRGSIETLNTMMEECFTEASFELATSTLFQGNLTKDSTNVISINVGSSQSLEFHGGIHFLEDGSYSGGDTIRTEDTIIGDGEGLSLYQSARFGNFLYLFENLEPGNYMVDLHFAEIVYTTGPSGMRIFDVFLKEEKVISCLDIYARVGANKPLVISDLKTCIDKDEELSIRFEGVIGSPIISGISIRRDSSQSSVEIDLSQGVDISQCESNVCWITLETVIQNDLMDGEFDRLQRENELQKRELSEMKRILEELRTENKLKSNECQEAWKSLKELQSELMRKSMHVGSLAFAIEGQVKEKSRWFSSLRDLTRKMKILKMDHLKLSQEASMFKQYFGDVEDVRSIIQSTMDQHAQLYEDIKIKFLQEVKERKQLYNKVLELKGNIRVFCRCRPLNNEEIAAGAAVALDFEAAKDGELSVKSNGITKKTYKFDNVFSPETDQVDVFEETAPLATSVLDGYNVCVFAYGQTGTGKTFTMEGTSEARGVNYRTLQKLFDIIEERKNTFRYEVSVSVLEVYNEQIRDLLVSGSQLGMSAKKLEIKQVIEGGHHVPGLVEAQVNNVSEVWEVLRTGSNGRAVGSTNANEHSSRSHCMHCVMVKGENLLNGECTRSKLWLVDLAGSERIAKTEVQGERLKETQNINRSLSALGDVISALATKSPHIPFRNSKLTHLLQDSLGGDSKTLMFVQISPNENDLSETLCSLNFASRVRGIELGPAKKQMDSTEFLRHKQMVEKLKQDMKSKDFQVKKMEDANYCLEVKLKEKDMKNRSLQDKIKELETQLLVERKLARQHVDSRIAEQHTKQEERSREPGRAPLATKILPLHKPQSESKDQENVSQSSEVDKFSFHPAKTNDSMEKENNPEIAEHLLLPKRTGRASLCPNFQKIPVALDPRRNSLIPFPSTVKFTPNVLPLTPIQADDKAECDVGEEAALCLPEKTPCASPKEYRNGNKKNSLLRRSLQKRINTKSPMQPLRRVGVNVGMEKVRVSIGGRGRNGQRVFLGSARRAVARDASATQKLSHRDKEKRWNLGSTATRTLL